MLAGGGNSMRYFMSITGVLITLTFLLAILAGSAQASKAAPCPTEDTQPAEDASPMIYLVLAGSAALLAAFVWLGMLRRVQEPSLGQNTAQDLTSNDGETE
jgi:TRAP-type C4-dicarboxylate transport system permease small subunit